MGINRFFTGYGIIKITGENIEGFTNAALKEGIDLRDFRRRSDGCRVTAPVKDLGNLRYLAHLNGVHFTISSVGGLPRVYRSLKVHKIPGVVICLTLLFLVIYCQSILFVAFEGSEDITKEEQKEIMSMAAEYGVTPGLWRRDIDWNTAAHSIMAAHPNLSWVGFDRNGVIMTVQAVAKDIEDQNAHLSGNVVAKKDGVIKSILVLEGQGLVEKGTPVKEGDVVISGDIYYSDDEGNSLGEPNEVHAKGLVEANVWYTAEVTVALRNVEAIATGKEANRVVMNWQGKEYTIWGSDRHNYSDWQEKAVTKKISQSLSFTTVSIEEMTPKIVTLTQSQGEAKAKKQAYADVYKDIPKKAEIVNKRAEIIDSGSPDTVKVRITVETIENIGVFQSFTGNF